MNKVLIYNYRVLKIAPKLYNLIYCLKFKNKKYFSLTFAMEEQY